MNSKQVASSREGHANACRPEGSAPGAKAQNVTGEASKQFCAQQACSAASRGSAR